MAEHTPGRRPDSLLVSLKELRQIEHDRLDHERTDELRREQARLEAERTAREQAERLRCEERQREREEREQREREERLRLGEAERRARVEAEMALERQRLALELGARASRPSMIPLACALALASVLAGLCIWLGLTLRSEAARAVVLTARNEQLQSKRADAERIAEDQRREIAALGSRLARSHSGPCAPTTLPAPAGPSPRQRGRAHPRRQPAPSPPPTIPSTCLGSPDPLCGVLKQRERKRP